MSTRDRTLDAIRRQLGAGAADDAARRERIAQRMAQPPDHLRPALSDLGGAEDGMPGSAAVVARFQQCLVSHAASMARVSGWGDVPAEVARFVDTFGGGRRAVISASLRGLPWPEDWQLDTGAAGIEVSLGVSRAWRGVAETGSLLMWSGPSSPITHHFVPETEVITLAAGDIVAYPESCWADFRAGGEPMPRALNIIAGPSRTGDVEQTIELGAHGPRRLHVIVVG